MYNVRPNLLIGFHGCDIKIQQQLLNNPNEIIKSENHSIGLEMVCIWENNYDRALEWAEDKKKRGDIETPAVIGAVISLGYCLDLIDSQFIKMLGAYYQLMIAEYKTIGLTLPENKDIKSDEHKDKF